MTDVEVIVPREQKILLLHHLTYPEVLASKKGVSDMSGYLVGGPDRKGANAIHPSKLWLCWQRDVQTASKRKGAVPQPVLDYFEHTKRLTSPPKGDLQPLVYSSIPSTLKGDIIFDADLTPDAPFYPLDAQSLDDLVIPITTLSAAEIAAMTPQESTVHLGIDLGMNLDAMAPTMPVAAASGPCQGKLANPPRFATSFSGMESFLTCPMKWAADKYYKVTRFEETEAIKWGNRVHLTAENYVKNALDKGSRPVEAECLALVKRYCDFFLSLGAEIHVEKELCCTKDLKPCGWKDWNTVWFRGKGDLIIIKDRKLIIPDWKTGKRKDDTFQIEVMIAMADLYFGDKFDTADGKLIFLKEPDPKKAMVGLPKVVTKAEIPGIWERIFAITNRMEEAWASANFRMQTNGLCKNYCDNIHCPHNGKR